MGIEENIAPGKILYLYIALPPDYEYDNKYMVVVSADPLLLLKINTSGEQTAMAKKFNERQFTIKKSIYAFLKYDSYLDCGTVWYSVISRDEAIKQLTEDSSRIKGELIPDHRNELVRLSGQSRSISTTHKRIIAKNCR